MDYIDTPLYSPAVVRELLSRYGLRADKGFGQNFLVDGNILGHIVAAAGVTTQDTVLEVGPGLGVLTRALAAQAREVVSVELDGRLLRVLTETLAAHQNVKVMHQDALTFDFTTLPEGSLFVSNLPYNIATPLLVKALEAGVFRRLVFLVQKEVAQRLVAGVDSAHYGVLSLVVAHFARAEVMRDVSAGAFYPPPEVTSSVVRLEPNGAKPDPALFGLIGMSFRHRRKTLKKNLTMAGYRAEEVTRALEALDLNPAVRAERLTLEQFKALKEFL